MSSGKNEKLMVFETVLSSPGLNDKTKISVQVSRLAILAACRLLEEGLLRKELQDELISILPKEIKEELQGLITELLNKAGWAEFYERLKKL